MSTSPATIDLLLFAFCGGVRVWVEASGWCAAYKDRNVHGSPIIGKGQSPSLAVSNCYRAVCEMRVQVAAGMTDDGLRSEFKRTRPGHLD